jgi:pimeloyl-ACP methyl ester carboxylesterase
MTAITEANIEANGVTFAYRAAGDEAAPLALLLHGFPDSAHTWRHLLPLLAGAGYRAVAPWLRGYAPSTVPSQPAYQSAVIGLDAVRLHQALTGGDGRDAVLIGHDWGAFAGYAAVQHAEAPWRRLVTMAVPPMGAVAQGFLSYDQLHRSWYMFLFQHPLAEVAVLADDLAFIERLWADWSPGYDAAEDVPAVKDALRAPENLAAALGYYRAMLGATGRSDDPEVVALQAAADGGSPPVPTLYLHGADDGCIGVELAATVTDFLAAEGSRAEIVPGAGHFLHLERPDEVGRLVLDFVGAPHS